MSLLEVRDHASISGGLDAESRACQGLTKAGARAVRSGKRQPLGLIRRYPCAQIQDGRSPEREESIPYSLSL